MKTFTLRLTDLEAEALDRLAYIAGQSKNKLIECLIAREYGNTLNDTGVVIGDELLYLVDNACFAETIADQTAAALNDGSPAVADSDVIKVARCYDYAIEHAANDEEGQALEKKKYQAVFDLTDR